MTEMLIFFSLFLASVVAVAATTRAVLKKWRVSRIWRVLVWSGLVLLLPVYFAALYMYMLALGGWHSC